MEIKYENGLIPAIVQDARSGKVLMLGYMTRAALEQTESSGAVTFFSRSRQKLWVKGETSGHRLRVREIRVDCDADALLIEVEMAGPGCCHMGYESCFYRKLTPEGEEIIASRQFDPAQVYASGKEESRK
jgi:phosphoribosyl-AMP cyclohydrolase